MATSGGCMCGTVRYEVERGFVHVSVCHCADCRLSAGAPMVGWADAKADEFRLTAGEPTVHASSPGVSRAFCPACGTGLYYINEQALPGLVAIQSCTLDDPEAAAPELHVQDAERLGWTRSMDMLPSFPRYPG